MFVSGYLESELIQKLDVSVSLGLLLVVKVQDAAGVRLVTIQHSYRTTRHWYVVQFIRAFISM